MFYINPIAKFISIQIQERETRVRKRYWIFLTVNKKMAGISSIGVLPEDCVSAILSLTTPTDAGKLSLVSSMFRSAAESDVVWSRFLPKNYAEIVAASDISGESPLCSKREAFFRLCSPILIDGGKKVNKQNNSVFHFVTNPK